VVGGGKSNGGGNHHPGKKSCQPLGNFKLGFKPEHKGGDSEFKNRGFLRHPTKSSNPIQKKMATDKVGFKVKVKQVLVKK